MPSDDERPLLDSSMIPGMTALFDRAALPEFAPLARPAAPPPPLPSPRPPLVQGGGDMADSPLRARLARLRSAEAEPGAFAQDRRDRAVDEAVAGVQRRLDETEGRADRLLAELLGPEDGGTHRMVSLDDIAELVRAVDRLTDLEEKHGRLIEALARRLRGVETRVARGEA